MASANFTVDDAIQAVREQIEDDASRRIDDTDILNLHVPKVLQQLRADRPDLWIGAYGTESFKPAQTDPLPFDDMGFNAFVEALLASVEEKEDEAMSDGSAAGADARSQRARRQ